MKKKLKYHFQPELFISKNKLLKQKNDISRFFHLQILEVRYQHRFSSPPNKE